eukprot:scaffold421221_cov91-Attheya_sp.AAC.2
MPPISVRHSAKSIQEFRLLGVRQQDEQHVKCNAEMELDASPVPHACSPCMGISLAILLEDSRTHRQVVGDGFKYLVAEAMRARATKISSGTANTSYSKRCGILINKNNNSVEYQLRERVNPSCQDQVSNFVFHHHECKCNAAVEKGGLGTLVCGNCLSGIKKLRRKCQWAVEIRAKERIDLRTRENILEISPSLYKKVKGVLMEDRQKTQKREHARNILKELLEERRGGDAYSINADLLFNSQAIDLADQYFDDENIPQDHIVRYLFAESCRASAQARKSGSNNVRYSPIMIRFAISLFNKLKKDKYEFLRKVFNLPSSRRLNDYMSPGGNAPSGIVFDLLEQQRTLFEGNNKDLERLDWRRHGSLSWDSCCIRDKLTFNSHSLELVGFADDAFDIDVVKAELLHTCDSNTESLPPISETEGDTNQEADDTGSLSSLNPEEDDDTNKPRKNDDPLLPAMAKHYLVFMFTTWDKNSKPVRFVAARYGLNSLTSPFLIRRVREITVALWRYGFLVNNITGDGASENRSTFKSLATLTAEQVFSHFTPEEKTLLPMKQKVAFYHPALVDEKILVFIGGEMPHLIKKVVNALEKSDSMKSKRNLKFRGKSLSLNKLQKLFIASGGDDYFGSLRQHYFGVDHFDKDAHSRMRVHLAVQITSQHMIQLIDEYSEKCGGVSEYAPSREIIASLDRLIDICNNTGMSGNNVFKGCEPICSPTHSHLPELARILMLFTEWKNEAGSNKDAFISQQSYEDLTWLVFGFTGIAQSYLDEDGSKVMIQKRGGSDCCEHHFADLKCSNRRGGIDESRKSSARAAGVTSCTFSGSSKTNTSGDKQLLKREINSPMPRKKPAKRHKSK